MTQISNIENLIKAKYDLLYINTFEEVRVIDDMLHLARELGVGLCTWSFSSGIKYLEVDDDKIREDSIEENCTGDPIGILNHIRESTKDVLFILKDYHSFLQDVEVTRMLKDTIQVIKDNYTPIAIISPIVKIPIELEKEIVLVDFDLPNEQVINDIISMAIDSMKIELTIDEINECIEACKGLTASEIENALSRSIVETGTIVNKEILKEKRQIIRKNGILEFINTEESISNVGGMANLKKWLSKRATSFTEEARDFGLPMPKGLMLTGVPGCGKSMLCKSVSNLWHMPLLKLDMGSIMNSLVGSSEENMRKALQVASAVSPCVLWIK